MEDIFARFKLPAYESIPDVGLYLEQVVRYINSFFADLPEMQVTASMITNYVKQKIVPKTGRKTYGRGHIAAFLFIAMAKSVLSMNHLRLFFERCEGEDPAALYEDFRGCLARVLLSFSETEPGREARPEDGERSAMMEKVCTAIAHHMYLERYFREWETARAPEPQV